MLAISITMVMTEFLLEGVERWRQTAVLTQCKKAEPCLLMVLLPLKAMQMWVVSATTWVHDVHSPCCCWELCLALGPAEGRVDAHGSCYHWRPCGCPWYVLLPPEAILISVGQEAAGDHISVHGLHCHRGPFWGLWLMPETRWMYMVHAVPRYYEEVHDQ